MTSRRFSERDDDSIFPLRKTIETHERFKTIPWLDLAHIDSSIESLTNNFYPTISGQFFDAGSLRERVVRTLDSEDDLPRHFDRPDVWKCVTPDDVEYGAGFTDVVFNGSTSSEGSPGGVPTQPYVEKLQFDRDELHGQPEFQREPNHSREHEARELLAAFEEQRVVWQGCPELQIETASNVHCCHATPKTTFLGSHAKLEAHFDNSLHQRVQCAKNNNTYSFISNINVNQTNLSGGHQIHIFAMRPLRYEKRDHIYSVLRQNGHKPHFGEMTRMHMSEIEMGFVSPDSGLQRSLQRQRRHLQSTKKHPFLSSSPRYRSETNDLILKNEMVGPPLYNATQLYGTAEWTRLMEQTGKWDARRQPKTLSVGDKSKSQQQKERE